MRTLAFLFTAMLPTLAIFGQTGGIPAGFALLFNGKDLTGWHISQENHHGNTRAWRAENGVLTVAQDKPGNGGILLTDKKYRNFEIYLEIDPDWGCDGGLFLRSTEKGEAYQVMIDYLPGGSVGGIYGEGLEEVNKTLEEARQAKGWEKAWKRGEWNTLRARIEGEAPHIQVWINGTQIVDWTDTANHSIGNAAEGMIALQAHLSNATTPRWNPGGHHRFRNIAIKELEP